MIDIADVLSNSKELDDPIFVVGCARSGTSVLARTIGLSEQVCYFGETRLIPKYYNRHVPLRRAIRNWRNGEPILPVLKGKARRTEELLKGTDYLRDLIVGMIRHTKLIQYDLRAINGRLTDRYNVTLAPKDIRLAGDLYYKYTQLATKDVDKMLRIVLKDFQLLSSKSKVLEKTPSHALCVLTLKRLFPQAKICFILRDGRDVAASYLLNYRETTVDDRTIRYICRAHRQVRRIYEKLSNSDIEGYYLLSYEDLVRQPVASVESLFKFLDLPFSERVSGALLEVRPTPSKWDQLPAHKQKYVDACLGTANIAIS